MIRSYALAIALALPLVSCSKPAPPTLEPKTVELLLTEDQGPVVRVDAIAHNPNSFAIPVRDVNATLKFGTVTTGNVTAKSLDTLAPQADTPVSFLVTAPWKNLAGAVGNARIPGDNVPYTVTGTAKFDAKGREFSLPFTMDGTVSKKAVLMAVLKHVPIPPGAPPVPTLTPLQ